MFICTICPLFISRLRSSQKPIHCELSASPAVILLFRQSESTGKMILAEQKKNLFVFINDSQSYQSDVPSPPSRGMDP